MIYGRVPGIDKPVSRIVQGLVMVREDNLDSIFPLLDAVFETGVNTFDTAHLYAGGQSERGFAAWVRDRGLRDRVVLLDKGAHHNAERRRVTPEDITSDLTESLERLEFDFIDLYVLHRDDPDVPVGPIVEVLNEHLKAGRIHAFGGSNWTIERLAEANAYARAHDLSPFVVSSPNYNLAEMVQEPWPNCVSIGGPAAAESRKWYEQSQMAVFSWSTLAGGFLTGRYTRENIETSEDRGAELARKCYACEDNFRRLDRLTRLAEARGVSLPQAAIAYVLCQPMNTFPLVAAWAPEEARANARSADARLSPEEMAWCDLRTDEPPSGLENAV